MADQQPYLYQISVGRHNFLQSLSSENTKRANGINCKCCLDSGSFTIADNSPKHGHFGICPFCNNKAVLLANGRYEIVKRVGEGNFSAVFLAKDRWSTSSSLEDPVVALKIFHSQYEDLGRAEAECLKRIGKEDRRGAFGTLRFCHAFRHEKIHFVIVTEALLPTDLFERSTTPSTASINGNSLAPILPYMGQLIHSLALNLYLLHERLQRVHGDLKPENILYSRTQRRFKLVDYGNSAPLESLSFYWDDFEFGSRLYRAPEIFVGMPFGMGVDIWALGALLFEALTAKALCSSLDSIVYLRQLCDLVGPLPVSFSTGKFYPKAGLPLVNDFEDISTEDGIFAEGASTAHPMGDGFWKRWRMSMLLQETGIKDVMLLDLLSQMLDPNPETRINIRQVLGHPFLASFMPFLPSLMPALEETTPTPTPAPRAGKEDIPPAASDNVDAEIEVLVSQLKKDDLTGKKGGRKAVITQGKRRKVI